MVLHADGNSFYASCEQIYRPDLRGKPVAVLSNNDGVIIALNKEAKACGIKRGDPYFKVRDICKCRGITIFSSTITLYALRQGLFDDAGNLNETALKADIDGQL